MTVMQPRARILTLFLLLAAILPAGCRSAPQESAPPAAEPACDAAVEASRP
jgi:hypothetical protein